jgi:metal-responsive CopG/Arc/MetJ family transcriptional regulator
MVRTHVMLPESLVADLDAVVEKHGRSAFVEEAIREKVLRHRQFAALRRTAGALRGAKAVAWAGDPTLLGPLGPRDRRGRLAG